jgi:outer membrane receptor for Fe3+-dicitrate
VVSGWYLAPGGVQIAAIVGYSSGRPYNILAGTDLNGDGDGGSSPSDRPRRVPGDPSTSIARNAGLLPSRATTDIRVSRRFTVRGRLTVEPMVDVFNLFNRTNFIGVQNVFGPGRYPDQPLPTYGQFTQAAAPRQVQIGLKVGF